MPTQGHKVRAAAATKWTSDSGISTIGQLPPPDWLQSATIHPWVLLFWVTGAEVGPPPQPEFGRSFRALLPDENNSLDYAEAEAVNSFCAKLTGICFGFAASCFANTICRMPF